MRQISRLLPLRAVCMFLACQILTGCYLVQATVGHVDVMSRREPIAEVLNDPQTSQDLKGRLAYVLAAREFATRELGLPDNESYRQYADLGRRYVVWNVFATPPYAVEPRRWCFPIAGCVVYRGYFAERGARRYARGRAARGDDVAVAGVAAYSTLGHFADPVLNTMLGWSDAQLAGTLFHELAHQVLYVPGDSAFNEAFATVVEETAVARWLESTGRTGELERWREQRHRAVAFTTLLLGTRERLRSLYASDLSHTDMHYRKQQTFGRLKFEYSQLRAGWNGDGAYDAWFDRTLNNAHLVPVATYRACVPGFERLLFAAGGQLPDFYAQARTMAALPAPERQRLLCQSEPQHSATGY